MSTQTPEFFPTLLRSWGIAGNMVTTSAESAVGNVARWSHRVAEIADATIPSNIVVLKRSSGASWRRRGGREEEASLRTGELGLLAEGGYGDWLFDDGEQSPHEMLHVYLPNRRLSELAADGGQGRPELQDRLKLRDPVLQMLMRQVDSAIDDIGTRRLYIESLLTTIAARALETFAVGAPIRPTRGGLAPWQLKRACEAMMAQIDGDPGLDDLAAVTGCSPTHFSRAFKQSTGVAPFHWLAERRIEKAKALLADSRLPLAEVALAVGFAAQPQFTTAFGRATGMTPGRWRREWRL